MRVKIDRGLLDRLALTRGKWRTILEFRALPAGHGQWTVNRTRFEAAFCLFPQSKPWPIRLRPLKFFARPADRGLGDIIHRLLGPMGRVYPRLFKRIVGRECGCRSRRARWNRRWPLPGPPPPAKMPPPLSRSQVLDNAIQVRDRKSSISF